MQGEIIVIVANAVIVICMIVIVIFTQKLFHRIEGLERNLLLAEQEHIKFKEELRERINSHTIELARLNKQFMEFELAMSKKEPEQEPSPYLMDSGLYSYQANAVKRLQIKNREMFNQFDKGEF